MIIPMPFDLIVASWSLKFIFYSRCCELGKRKMKTVNYLKTLFFFFFGGGGGGVMV
jgi:hypothetical protein